MKDEIIKRLPWQCICNNAKNFGFSEEIIGAIVMVESGGNKYAVRHEPGWKHVNDAKYWAKKIGSSIQTEIMGQSTSWGYGQIMGGTARFLGFGDWFPKLCTEEINIYLMAKYLRILFNDYQKIEDVIASYNAGKPRIDKNGKYLNQHYVDIVVQYMEELS